MINRLDLKILGDPSTIGSQPIAVFPLISIQNFGSKFLPKYFEPEGTGFFIHKSGLFVTAKHVPLMDGKILRTFIGIHDHAGNISVRHVRVIATHPKADISVGYFDKYDVHSRLIYRPNTQYWHLIPNFGTLALGDKVRNFGYGGSLFLYKHQRQQLGNFKSQWGSGEITQLYPDGRDTTFLPGPTVETTLQTLGKASGGPVFNEIGEVIGVNSTSFDGPIPISYFTPISTILDIEIQTDYWGKFKVSKLFYPKGIK